MNPRPSGLQPDALPTELPPHHNIIMGRVRTMLIKKIAMRIFEENKEKFSDDFEKNKEILKEILKVKSKKIRNKVAGYITKIVKLLKSS